MFQEFPYTNFHELNLDWIVKIAKDFLDQYTHIQEVIQTGLEDLAESRETGLAELDHKRIDSLAELNQKTLDGLADLQEKYDTLDGLLQAWYDTHSADIAGQLADAIADFNAAAEAKSQALLDSWPADYSELVTEYNNLKSALQYNSEKYNPQKNILTLPNLDDTTNYPPDSTSAASIPNDECNIMKLTNSGSTVRYYFDTTEQFHSGDTLYVYMLARGTSKLTLTRIKNTTPTAIFTTDTLTENWQEITYQYSVDDDITSFRISVTNLGYVEFTKLIISKTPINYDYSVKDKLLKTKAVADASAETLDGNVGVENLNDQLQDLFYYIYNAIDLTFESGNYGPNGELYSGQKHATISIEEGEVLELTSRHGLDMKMFVVKNSLGQVVEYYPTNRVTTQTETKEYTAPCNGTLYLNTYDTSVSYAKERAGLILNGSPDLAGKTWYALGDSITAYATGYHAIIGSETGLVVTNGGVSGSGYKKPVNNQTFVDRANLSRVYDKVTVFGSVNDMIYVGEYLGTETDTGTTTLGGCFNTLIDNLYASGNYHIGIISPIPNNSQNGNPANSTGTFAQYTELLEKVCKRRGVPFLNLWKCSNMQPWDETFATAYMQDDTHPNTNGHKIFAPRIKSFVESL